MPYACFAKQIIPANRNPQVMIERFESENGRRLLGETLADQNIVNGNKAIATKLLDVIKLQELAPGEVLISQDGEDNDLFFVISGRLCVKANGRTIATREAGTHVGEMALIDPKSCRSASVLAFEKTVVAKIAEPEFSSIANENPDLWRRIAIELCNRLRNRNEMIRSPNESPYVFICSSSENVYIADEIQLKLDHHHSEVNIWTDKIFTPTKHTMEDLERELELADFAVVVLMGEDVVISRDKKYSVPRDNVLFELGLFIGQRTFIVAPRNIDLKFPSDLLGLDTLTFLPPDNTSDEKQLSRALGPVCTRLRSLFDNIGPR